MEHHQDKHSRTGKGHLDNEAAFNLMGKAMNARRDAHEAQTKLDIASLAKEFGKEIRDEIKAARDEAKKARDDDRAEAKAARSIDRASARNGQLWTWRLIAAVGLGLAALIDGG